jgi:hypothetical protein
LLVGQISIKDILPPRAWQHPQISGNAPVPHFVTGSKPTKLPVAWHSMCLFRSMKQFVAIFSFN